MIRRALPIRFDRATVNGRTEPLRVTVLTDDDQEHDVVMKISAGRECSVEGLANELLGSLLAADLDLPINEPFLVELDQAFIESLETPAVRGRLQSSNRLAFASKDAGRQWRRWEESDKLDLLQHDLALRILAFDAFIGNTDRSPTNSNMLVKDKAWRIIDHESAFSFRMKLFPRCEPWKLGNLNMLRNYGERSEHIFTKQLSKRNDTIYDTVRSTWTDLSDVRFSQYDASLPDEWDEVRLIFNEALVHLKQVRDNIEPCIEELKRVLT